MTNDMELPPIPDQDLSQETTLLFAVPPQEPKEITGAIDFLIVHQPGSDEKDLYAALLTGRTTTSAESAKEAIRILDSEGHRIAAGVILDLNLDKILTISSSPMEKGTDAGLEVLKHIINPPKPHNFDHLPILIVTTRDPVDVKRYLDDNELTSPKIAIAQKPHTPEAVAAFGQQTLQMTAQLELTDPSND